jgi:polyisoprenoid-binding protein YceI
MATWSIDTGHSAVHFGVRHMMFTKTRGRFTRWNGELRLDPANLAGSGVEVTIDAASIDTGDAQRDAHLRSADFLDVEKFPTLSFRSTKVEDLGAGKLRVHGDLTIRGVTHPVALETDYAGRVKDPWGNDRAGFTARTAIDRTEFGLRWNLPIETGGLLVGNKVEIELEVEAVAAAATKAA